MKYKKTLTNAHTPHRQKLNPTRDDLPARKSSTSSWASRQNRICLFSESEGYSEILHSIILLAIEAEQTMVFQHPPPSNLYEGRRVPRINITAQVLYKCFPPTFDAPAFLGWLSSSLSLEFLRPLLHTPVSPGGPKRASHPCLLRPNPVTKWHYKWGEIFFGW